MANGWRAIIDFLSMSKFIRNLALLGDAVYIIWILYNGIDEGFRSIRTVQAVALIGLIILLILNIILLSRRR